MKKYIGKRMLQLVIVILGVTFMTYLVTSITPSDPAEMQFLSMGIAPSHGYCTFRGTIEYGQGGNGAE